MEIEICYNNILNRIKRILKRGFGVKILADIKMSYIIIEKCKDETRSIREIILSCLNNSKYRSDDKYLYIDENNKIEYSIKNKKTSQRYYLEISSKLRMNKGSDALSNIDKLMLSSSEQKYINVIRVYDGVSAAFCEKLYPKYALFERLLRQLILLVLTKSFGANWRDKTISEEQLKKMKEVAKSKGVLSLSDTLEQMDLYSMENYLFERREINYQSFFDEKLGSKDIKEKDKEELCKLIEEMRPRSLWERNFEMIGNQEKWKTQIFEIHNCRNKVAHSKKITKSEYEDVNKKLNKLNNDLKNAISKLQDKDFENVNSIDILSNFAITIGKSLQCVIEKKDFSNVMKNINVFVQEIVNLMQNTKRQLQNTQLSSMSANVITAFESAKELDEIARSFSKNPNK